jgi:hypothetical protein
MSSFALIALAVLLIVPNVSAQSLLATVPVADYPQAMALNPFTDRIYTTSGRRFPRPSCNVARPASTCPKTTRPLLRT